jgi:S-adenosylhomocysteine hydrolase
MLLLAQFVVCCQKNTNKNIPCGQSVLLLDVKLVVHIVTTGIERFKCLLWNVLATIVYVINDSVFRDAYKKKYGSRTQILRNKIQAVN